MEFLLWRDGHSGTDETLARLEGFVEPEGEAYFVITSYSIHYTKLYDGSPARRLERVAGLLLDMQTRIEEL